MTNVIRFFQTKPLFNSEYLTFMTEIDLQLTRVDDVLMGLEGLYPPFSEELTKLNQTYLLSAGNPLTRTAKPLNTTAILLRNTKDAKKARRKKITIRLKNEASRAVFKRKTSFVRSSTGAEKPKEVFCPHFTSAEKPKEVFRSQLTSAEGTKEFFCQNITFGYCLCNE